jgi:AcrR family transcriptional regulator
MPDTRQERLREATRQEIKAAARKLMGEVGTAGVSIRAISRELGLTPPALYHYYDSLDALITALILDAFNALADAMEAARDAEQGDSIHKLMSVMIAYRRWALEHAVDFQLIYGNPIPGYNAPADLTVPAAARGFAIVVGIIEQARRASPSVSGAIPRTVKTQLEQVIQHEGYPVSPLALYNSVSGWVRIHGTIMLELYGHLEPVVGDVDAFYRAQLEGMLREMGLTD